jgi:catechol 2,3-dioxygenase-like lactoylglutathione lyase family enzyme
MIRHFDHVTIVVRDLEAARGFFGLLGFVEDKAVRISGPQFSAYMGVEDIEAAHVTLVLAGATPRLEVQLLQYHHPEPLAEPAIDNLARVGFNHVCFAVDDLEAEVARLQAAGVQLRNAVMEFHHRKLVFLRGPEDITVELAEWKGDASP